MNSEDRAELAHRLEWAIGAHVVAVLAEAEKNGVIDADQHVRLASISSETLVKHIDGLPLGD